MQEREKILSGKKGKKRAPAARTVQVSLDRADAIIEGGAPFAVWYFKRCGHSGFAFSSGCA
jgi:hypothetical protein